MSDPPVPVAYCTIGLDIHDDGTARLIAMGCVMDPDGQLQNLGGAYQFSVGIDLAFGPSADEVKAAIGQAIADSYGGEAPYVVLVPSF